VLQRKIPAPGFQVEIVMVGSDGSHAKRLGSADKESDEKTVNGTDTRDNNKPSAGSTKDASSHDKDDVFSDSESEGTESSRSRHVHMASNAKGPGTMEISVTKVSNDETTSIGSGIERVPLRSEGVTEDPNAIDPKYEDDNIKSASVLEASNMGSTNVSEFKPVVADASVFSFGDEDEYESD